MSLTKNQYYETGTHLPEVNAVNTTPEPKKVALYKALANFQFECPPILKGAQAYGYKYADLPAILEVIIPIMKKHKLGFYQAIANQGLKTVIFHTVTGETIEASVDIPATELKGQNLYQVMGSSYTYFRRYQLSAILGIVSDADNDAQGQQISRNPAPVSAPNEKPEKIKLSVNAFNKLVGAIMTAQKDKAGELITVKYAVATFDLTPSQVETLQTL